MQKKKPNENAELNPVIIITIGVTWKQRCSQDLTFQSQDRGGKIFLRLRRRPAFLETFVLRPRSAFIKSRNKRSQQKKENASIQIILSF